MKKLTIKEILITLLLSYSVWAYVYAELNPINWGQEIRAMQIVFTVFSLGIYYLYKNGDFKLPNNERRTKRHA
jgi:hypothetical protein